MVHSPDGPFRLVAPIRIAPNKTTSRELLRALPDPEAHPPRHRAHGKRFLAQKHTKGQLAARCQRRELRNQINAVRRIGEGQPKKRTNPKPQAVSVFDQVLAPRELGMTMMVPEKVLVTDPLCSNQRTHLERFGVNWR